MILFEQYKKIILQPHARLRIAVAHMPHDTVIDRSDAHIQHTPRRPRHSNAHHLIHLCCLHGEIDMADALRKERLECVLSSGFV